MLVMTVAQWVAWSQAIEDSKKYDRRELHYRRPPSQDATFRVIPPKLLSTTTDN